MSCVISEVKGGEISELTSGRRVCPLDAAPASNYLGMDEVIREIDPAPAESRGNSTAWHHQPFRKTGQRAVVVALAIPVQSLVFIPKHVLDVKVPGSRKYLGIADTSVSAGLGIARKLAVLRRQEVRQSSGEREDVHGMDVVMYNTG
ncbi:similar to oxidoreductase NAD-binding domain-containing protein 1 [Aspergillus luchuensis]|uniref:Similar to oxidoreductase NAD-binding domain-containing protein 1 n=1 Tax=Aspergillus kawachii TaxID=1069201 RepID=A0A146FW30_ASPKA|nr:similar to oxidoreductase NAD-binding domain-containing protein 1 [Aspergillus luchuensis]